MVGLAEQEITVLKTQIRGDVILPEDESYDQVRQIWNAMIDRRPRLIVRCAGAADVKRSIHFAATHDLLLAVRGAGHNIAGNAVCDDGLMIDLSQMNSVRIDPQKRRAYVEPGAVLGDLDHEAQAFGLVLPLGINSTTGVSGLTLGGGFGWLSRKYGLTIDSLRSVEMVTASGDLVHASESENKELFWALRGGGGNFGVVIQFEFDLHPLDQDILAGLLVFPAEQGTAILKQYRDYVSDLPEESNVWVVLRKAPPLPFLPDEVHGKDVVVLALFHAGDHQQGQELVQSVRSFGQPYGEHVGAMPYCAWQQAFDPLLTPGARNYWKSHNFSEIKDEAIATILEYAAQLPSDQTEMFIGLLGGQITRIDQESTAYRQRDAQFVLNVHTRWEEASEDHHCVDWARTFFKATAPFATGGVYVNFMTDDESERIRAAYGAGYQKLVTVKTSYDPHNLFRMNQNIKPAA